MVFLLTLSDVTYSISCLGRSQLQPFIVLPNLVVGKMTDLSLSSVLAGDSPKSMKFGLSSATELCLKSILQQYLTSVLSSETVLQLIELLKMGVGFPCSREKLSNRSLE